MRKYTIGDHPEITLDLCLDSAKFFGGGAKFDMLNLKEKIKTFKKEDGKIIVIGVSYARCSITTDNVRLDKIEHILNDYIGASIGDVENIEID